MPMLVSTVMDEDKFVGVCVIIKNHAEHIN